MAKFIRKLMLLALLISLCLGALVAFDIFVIGGQYQNLYVASANEKLERLKRLESPKIILVANSNAAFGFNSELIQEEMGMEVVNLGLHGGLGNAFHEEMAKQNIGPGDLVVVCHNDYGDSDKLDDPYLAWCTYDYSGRIWPVFRWKDYGTLAAAYPKYLRSAYDLWWTGTGNIDDGSSYSRNSFNEYGDIVRRPAREQEDVEAFFGKSPIAIPKVGEGCVERLNRLNQFCTDRGATLVVAGYPIAYGKYADFTEADVEAFQTELASRLDCDVISDFTDYMYPYEMFYNSILHLTWEGATVRSEQLVQDLQNWQGN